MTMDFVKIHQLVHLQHTDFTAYKSYTKNYSINNYKLLNSNSWSACKDGSNFETT